MDQKPATERRFRPLIENALAGIALLDEQARMQYLSPGIERILGYHPDELTGRSAFELSHPDDLEQQQRELAALVARPGADGRYEYRLKHKNGSYPLIEVVAQNLLGNPDVGAIVLHWRDLATQQAVLTELKESEQRFRLLAENARDVVARYRVVPEPRADYISPSVERLTGYPPQDFYDDPHMHMKLIHPDDLPVLGALIADPSPENPRRRGSFDLAGAHLSHSAVAWLRRNRSQLRDRGQRGRAPAQQADRRARERRRDAWLEWPRAGSRTNWSRCNRT